jgi:AraC-like DNA-binding protein
MITGTRLGIVWARKVLTGSEIATSGRPPAAVAAAFSTAHLPAPKRFAYFCDGICDTFVGIRPEPVRNIPFDAAFTAIDFGVARLGIIRAPGHRAVRDASLLSRIEDDCIYVNHMDVAEARVAHAGRETRQRPGRSVLLDSTTPFVLELAGEDAFSLYSLRIEGGLASRSNPDAVRAVLGGDIGLMSNEGALLNDQMRLMVASVKKGDLRTAAIMAGAVRSLVDGLEGGSHDGDARFTAIAELVDAELHEPALSAATIARRLGCTARTIQARFAERGTTPGEWILARRLERARAMLEDPDQAFASAATIGYRCGFTDASPFSRAFRARFGVAPGALRKGVRQLS